MTRSAPENHPKSLAAANKRIAELQTALKRNKNRGKKPQPYQLYETDHERKFINLPDFLLVDHNNLEASKLMRGKRVAMFSPHPNDFVIRSGTTVHLLNRMDKAKKPLNKVNVIVVGTGHRGVLDSTEPDKLKKIDIRAEEGRQSAEALGLYAPKEKLETLPNGVRRWGQFETFNAHKTYDGGVIGEIHPKEQARMDARIKELNPNVVMVPSKFDRMQSMNANTRTMVLNSLRKHLRDEHKLGKKPEVLVMEYPTNQLASLPDKNLWVSFEDMKLVDQTKKKALAFQKSQNYLHADWDQMMEEGHEGLVEAEEFRLALSDRKKAVVSRLYDYGHIQGKIGGNSGRGEHFKLLKMKVAERSGVPVVKLEPIRSPGEYLAKEAGLIPEKRSKAEVRYLKKERRDWMRAKRVGVGKAREAAWKKRRKEKTKARHKK